MSQVLVIILIVAALVYFMIVMPQRRVRRQRQELHQQLQPGSDIVTAGGIHGTVTEIEGDDTVLIEVAEDTEIRVARSSIARILSTPAASDAAAAAEAGVDDDHAQYRDEPDPSGEDHATAQEPGDAHP